MFVIYETVTLALFQRCTCRYSKWVMSAVLKGRIYKHVQLWLLSNMAILHVHNDTCDSLIKSLLCSDPAKKRVTYCICLNVNNPIHIIG